MEKITRRSFVNKLGLGVGASAVMITLPSFLTETEKTHQPYTGKKLNIALCGLGNYASLLAEGLQVSEYCQLAGIVTGTPSKAETWKKKYNIPEKNIYNYENFDSIINNVQLAMGYRLHYEPNHLEVKRLGQEKVLGQVRYIETGLGYSTYDVRDINKPVDLNARNEWRLTKKWAGGGALINLGVYCIQVSRYVLGEEPIAVTAQFGHINNKNRFAQVEENITWQMEFPSGAVANCSSSYGFGIDRFYAAADEGFFEMSPAVSYGPFVGKRSDGKPFNFPVINQQQTQMDEICKVILANKKLPTHITGEEGIKDVRIINAIYKAAETGKKISLK